jgi:hypothetical protein
VSEDIPVLRDPFLVAAFSGWNDAADAATDVVDHLIRQWDARLLVELDPQEFYDFQQQRPELVCGDAGDIYLSWPTPAIYVAQPAGLDRDALLMIAPEPNYRWTHFCATVLGIASAAGVTEVVTIGALLADRPHTRPIAVNGTTSEQGLAERIGLAPSTYLGPIGINAVLMREAARLAMTSVSIWAAVPHYLAEAPCPKATFALLQAVEDAVSLALPHGDLRELSIAWQRGAEELAEHDEEIAEYVAALEADSDETDLPEATGDAIARDFERYLRRRNEDS